MNRFFLIAAVILASVQLASPATVEARGRKDPTNPLPEYVRRVCDALYRGFSERSDVVRALELVPPRRHWQSSYRIESRLWDEVSVCATRPDLGPFERYVSTIETHEQLAPGEAWEVSMSPRRSIRWADIRKLFPDAEVYERTHPLKEIPGAGFLDAWFYIASSTPDTYCLVRAMLTLPWKDQPAGRVQALSIQRPGYPSHDSEQLPAPPAPPTGTTR